MIAIIINSIKLVGYYYYAVYIYIYIIYVLMSILNLRNWQLLLSSLSNQCESQAMNIIILVAIIGGYCASVASACAYATICRVIMMSQLACSGSQQDKQEMLKMVNVPFSKVSEVA